VPLREAMEKASENRIALLKEYLVLHGFDVDGDEHLKDTPARIDRMYDEIFKGSKGELDIPITEFQDMEYKDLIICKDISVYSMCSHHLLPFFGVCHVAYIPKGKVVGLSKIPRIVEHFAAKPQIQERLVAEIADFMYERVSCSGVLVTMSATHLCTTMRGVKQPATKLIATAIRGGIDKREVLESIRSL